MPYSISDTQADCSGWATVKKESDGSFTTIGCHTTKQDALDQLAAVGLATGEFKNEGRDTTAAVSNGDNISTTGADSRSEMKKIERRTFTVQDVEARQAADGTMRLSGYAAVFNDPSVPLPFKESIAPGAFRKTLSETPDVRLLVNHEGLPLARTKNGTLTLTEDSRGLLIDAEIADTTEGRDLWTLVQRGDVDQMSFAFRVIRQKWNNDRTERTLTEVSLADGDVSVVTYPAYPTTTVEARERLMHAMESLKEGRALDGESTLVINTILEKVSDSYDSLEEGKTMLEVLLGLNTLTPTVEIEPAEVELMPTDVPAATAGRSISLRLAQAIVNNTK